MDLLRGRALLAVTAGLTVVFAGSAWHRGELTGAAAYLLVLANTVPLLLLPRNPLAVVLAFAITYPLWLDPLGAGPRDGHFLQSLPTLVALYATGAWQQRLWLRAVGLLTPAWMFGAAATGYWPVEVDDILYVALVMVFVWGIGVVDARRRAYAGELEVRTRQLEEAREALADRAVAEERARIARELHDVVAHAMSVITVQAGVGGHLLESRPHRAAEALGIIERTGREALGELRRMLVVLRPGDHRVTLPPQPGLDDLPALVASARATGLRVSMVHDGGAPRLSPGLDLTVYRVVQECLTNAAKHAPGARVEVRLSGSADRVAVEVRDHGQGAPGGVRPGHGLTGIAERVALYDGELEVDPGPGGFRVKASFPRDPDGRAA